MRPHRGNAVIPALILVAILAAVTVAMLRLSTISKDQSARDARALGAQACIDAARQYLISRLNLQAPAVGVQFDKVITTEAGDRHIYTGHVRPIGSDGKPSGTIAITGVQGIFGAAVGGGGGKGGMDLSNRIGGLAALNSAYQVVVGCSDPMAGDVELEFSLKFGL